LLEAYQSTLTRGVSEFLKELEHAEVIRQILEENESLIEKAEAEQSIVEENLARCEGALNDLVGKYFTDNKHNQGLRDAIYGMEHLPKQTPSDDEETKA
jgi:hypothetical protein